MERIIIMCTFVLYNQSGYRNFKTKKMNLNITHTEIMELSHIETELLLKLSIGRILRMLDREYQEGDNEMFNICSEISKSCGERLEILEIKEFIYNKHIHNHDKLSTSLLFS